MLNPLTSRWVQDISISQGAYQSKGHQLRASLSVLGHGLGHWYLRQAQALDPLVSEGGIAGPSALCAAHHSGVRC